MRAAPTALPGSEVNTAMTESAAAIAARVRLPVSPWVSRMMWS